MESAAALFCTVSKDEVLDLDKLIPSVSSHQTKSENSLTKLICSQGCVDERGEWSGEENRLLYDAFDVREEVTWGGDERIGRTNHDYFSDNISPRQGSRNSGYQRSHDGLNLHELLKISSDLEKNMKSSYLVPQSPLTVYREEKNLPLPVDASFNTKMSKHFSENNKNDGFFNADYDFKKSKNVGNQGNVEKQKHVGIDAENTAKSQGTELFQKVISEGIEKKKKKSEMENHGTQGKIDGKLKEISLKQEKINSFGNEIQQLSSDLHFHMSQNNLKCTSLDCEHRMYSNRKTVNEAFLNLTSRENTNRVLQEDATEVVSKDISTIDCFIGHNYKGSENHKSQEITKQSFEEENLGGRMSRIEGRRKIGKNSKKMHAFLNLFQKVRSHLHEVERSHGRSDHNEAKLPMSCTDIRNTLEREKIRNERDKSRKGEKKIATRCTSSNRKGLDDENFLKSVSLKPLVSSNTLNKCTKSRNGLNGVVDTAKVDIFTNEKKFKVRKEKNEKTRIVDGITGRSKKLESIVEKEKLLNLSQTESKKLIGKGNKKINPETLFKSELTEIIDKTYTVLFSVDSLLRSLMKQMNGLEQNANYVENNLVLHSQIYDGESLARGIGNKKKKRLEKLWKELKILDVLNERLFSGKSKFKFNDLVKLEENKKQNTTTGEMLTNGNCNNSKSLTESETFFDCNCEAPPTKLGNFHDTTLGNNTFPNSIKYSSSKLCSKETFSQDSNSVLLCKSESNDTENAPLLEEKKKPSTVEKEGKEVMKNFFYSDIDDDNNFLFGEEIKSLEKLKLEKAGAHVNGKPLVQMNNTLLKMEEKERKLEAIANSINSAVEVGKCCNICTNTSFKNRTFSDKRNEICSSTHRLNSNHAYQDSPDKYAESKENTNLAKLHNDVLTKQNNASMRIKDLIQHSSPKKHLRKFETRKCTFSSIKSAISYKRIEANQRLKKWKSTFKCEKKLVLQETFDQDMSNDEHFSFQSEKNKLESVSFEENYIKVPINSSLTDSMGNFSGHIPSCSKSYDSSTLKSTPSEPRKQVIVVKKNSINENSTSSNARSFSLASNHRYIRAQKKIGNIVTDELKNAKLHQYLHGARLAYENKLKMDHNKVGLNYFEIPAPAIQKTQSCHT